MDRCRRDNDVAVPMPPPGTDMGHLAGSSVAQLSARQYPDIIGRFCVVAAWIVVRLS
jgi:hypothetical protein